MGDVSLSVKLGTLEVEYSGPSSLAEEWLPNFIMKLSKVDLPDIAPHFAALPFHHRDASLPPTVGGSPIELSTADFAAKLGVKNGTGLLMAAAACLHHTRGMEEFRRSDLLQEIRGARAFYRPSYSSNLSKYLETMIKNGRLQRLGSDAYTLPYSEIEVTRKITQ